MTVLLFDFFGTLVDYSASRTTQGFRRSHALVPELSYERFLGAIDATFADFDRRSDLDDSEFSMHAVATSLHRTDPDPVIPDLSVKDLIELPALLAIPPQIGAKDQ